MRFNVIAETIINNKSPQCIHCAPTYCNLEPGSNRVSKGFRNISAKRITVPAKAIITQVELANMVPKLHAPVGQVYVKPHKEKNGSWIL